jgi:hypothetical protein
VTYQLIDDLDGQILADGDGETVSFGLDGKSFEIDLGVKHASELRAAIALYVEHARVVRRSPSRPNRSNAAQSLKLAEVRAWAKDNGYEVASRGRMPARVIDAYKRAN